MLLTPDAPEFHTVLHRFGEDADGLHMQRRQYLPDWWLDELRQEYDNSADHRAGEFHRVASIPVVFLEEMRAEGLDYNHAPANEIMDWLHNRGLSRFITSKKV